ncbi:unnamed protein product, partial [Phaeothamnion confervicola]
LVQREKEKGRRTRVFHPSGPRRVTTNGAILDNSRRPGSCAAGGALSALRCCGLQLWLQPFICVREHGPHRRTGAAQRTRPPHQRLNRFQPR